MNVFLLIVFLKIIIFQCKLQDAETLYQYALDQTNNKTKFNYMLIDPEGHLKNSTYKNEIKQKMINLYFENGVSNNIIIFNQTSDLETLVSDFSFKIKNNFTDKENYIIIVLEVENNNKIIKRGENVKLSNELDEILYKINLKENYPKKISELLTTIQEICGKNFSLFHVLIVYVIIACFLLLIITSLRFLSFKRGDSEFNRESRDSRFTYTSMTRINSSGESYSSVTAAIN